jgi:rhodanese-related sulfurtransferase
MSELVSPEELQRQTSLRERPTIIDVRSADENAAGHIPGALHIPAEELSGRLAEIPRDRPVVTY